MAAVHFHLSAHGVGDAVVGLYAACGLADAGHPATFHCRKAEWLAGVSHPGLTVLPWKADHGADANADYWGQLRAGAGGACASRAQWYCDNISRLTGFSPFAPARPRTVAKPPPVLPPGYALLFPYAHRDTSRDWPEQRWRELVGSLNGRRVVVVGENYKRPRLRRAFAGCEVYWGKPAAWVLSAVAHADHVYGNDSGMVHLAGLHGVRATAAVSHLPGKFLFAEATSVSWVEPDRDLWPCSPCGWQGAYTREKCGHGCPALAGIEAGRVPLPVLPEHELDAALAVGGERLVGAGG